MHSYAYPPKIRQKKKKTGNSVNDHGPVVIFSVKKKEKNTIFKSSFCNEKEKSAFSSVLLSTLQCKYAYT